MEYVVCESFIGYSALEKEYLFNVLMKFITNKDLKIRINKEILVRYEEIVKKDTTKLLETWFIGMNEQFFSNFVMDQVVTNLDDCELYITICAHCHNDKPLIINEHAQYLEFNDMLQRYRIRIIGKAECLIEFGKYN